MASCGFAGLFKSCFYTGWVGDKVQARGGPVGEGEVPGVGTDQHGGDGFITIDLTTEREDDRNDVVTAVPAVKYSNFVQET